MGIAELDQISHNLMKAGMKKSIKVAIVANGTTDKQSIVKGTLGTIAKLTKKADIRPPAVIVIGRVAGLSDKLDWFKRK
jgi:siroheme synthase